MSRGLGGGAEGAEVPAPPAPERSASADLELAHRLADAADAITLARFRAFDLQVETKPDLTPVSEADKAADDVYRSSMSMRAAEVELRFGADQVDRQRVLDRLTRALELDAHNERAAEMLEMLQRRRGDYLLDYQTPVEQARRRLGMGELPFVQLQRLPLKLIVSRHVPGAEALRDALDRAYEELRAAGEDLQLP